MHLRASESIIERAGRRRGPVFILQNGGVPPLDTVKKFFKEWILPFGLEILVLLFLLKYVFTFVAVPTGSMIPTIY